MNFAELAKTGVGLLAICVFWVISSGVVFAWGTFCVVTFARWMGVNL